MRKIITMSMLLILGACSSKQETAKVKEEERDLKEISNRAYKFCKSNKLNKDFYFLIDLKKHSGYKRFYVWNFNTNNITDTFMVSHGCSKGPWTFDFTKEKPVISNTENSHCSSIGKYLVQERGPSKFGIGVKYNLTGLDSTNNKARKRAIVLHGWNHVTDQEVYPNGTAEGWGCPAVSNQAMRDIDEMLKNKNTNTLMWVIN